MRKWLSIGFFLGFWSREFILQRHVLIWGVALGIVIAERAYIYGGILTFKETYQNGSMYLCTQSLFHPEMLTLSIDQNRADVWTDPSIIVADLTGGTQYPVPANNSIFSYAIDAPDDGELTQQAALWWDGQNSIYKYLPLSEISPATLALFPLLLLSIGWIGC